MDERRRHLLRGRLAGCLLSRFVWAAPELALYYICIVLYLHWSGREISTGKAWMRRILAIVAATNLLYHFPLLFTVDRESTARVWPKVTARSCFATRFSTPRFWRKFVHHLLASFAIVGIAMMGFALRLGRQGREPADVARAATWGGRLALVPTLLQLFVGLIVLLTLPDGARSSVLGDDTLATSLFVVALSRR